MAMSSIKDYDHQAKHILNKIRANPYN